ncbi:methyltransferase family protein [Vibrio algivorus]|uniref:Isoprenylcysteine carboxyl methyltransferase n=1 Tax=Vibrio algivorus TaxID=1667024 RepID=A0ABQ6ES24_9VIBR|nr:isoprenylcysteine carboxylmethyltransferase family protein [Vibrio algivorus]GLT15943.1 isoprenylcysteine carboxyl methyltransferase [Vibrio algivorus]
MQLLELKIKPPIVSVIAVMIMFGLDYWLPSDRLGVGQYRLGIVLGLVLIGFMLAVIGVKTFIQAETTIHPDLKHATNKLVTNGIYRLSRNPMYLGMLLNLLAISVWLNNWLTIGVCIGFVCYISQFQIKPEERFLQQRFGKQYTDYCKKVRRWL